MRNMKVFKDKLIDNVTSQSVDYKLISSGTIKRDVGIAVEGYGDHYSKDGEGIPILMEYYDGKLRLLVWSDINSEDPTHIIDMDKAREDNRNANS